MATDLSNWEQSSNNPNLYNRESSVAVDHEKRRKSKKQNIRVQTNISNGDYKVFATGEKTLGLFGNKVGKDIEIYSYDSEKDKYTVVNDTYMTDLFLDRITINTNTKIPSVTRDKFFDKFNLKIRRDTYNIAESEADTRLEKRKLDRLGDYKGYKSVANKSQQPPQTITRGAKKNNNSKGNSKTTPRSSTKEQTRSKPNTDILNPSDNSVFSLRPTQLKTKSKITNFNYMRYPEGRIPNLGYDYIQITAYDYVPVGVPNKYSATGQTVVTEQGGNRVEGFRQSAEDRLYKNPGDVIQFPMTGSISETSSVKWSPDTINEIQNIAAGIAYGRVTEGTDPFTATFGAFTDILKSMGTAVQSPEIRMAIGAYFAGQAVGANNLLQRTSGKMINNNLELLFTGPDLRSFNFTFNLRPRTKSEAELCRRIIRSLKKNSSPVRSSDFFFLETPSIFRLQYIYNQDTPDMAESGEVLSTSTQHPYLNKIKPCALTSVNVNYTPEGSYMTYEDGGSMTGYDLTLNFQEIEPIYRDDHEAAGSDNMGY